MINNINKYGISTTLLAVLLVFFTGSISAQNQPYMEKDYQEAWSKVQILEKENKTKDALLELGSIERYARENGDTEQYIKALVKKPSLEQAIEDGGELKTFRDMLQEIGRARELERAVLQSLLAEALNNYYQDHQYEILDRTNMSEEDSATDFETWDAVQFEKTIIELYLASISNKELLRKQPVEKLPVLLENAGENTWHPTLYDVLANRVIDYLAAGGANLFEIATPFVIDNKKAFSLPEEFISWNITTPDSGALLYRCLVLYQELTAWQMQQQDLYAFTDLNLKRMAFVLEKTVMEDKLKVKHYQYYLNKLIKTLRNHPAAAEVSAAVSQSYYDNANGNADRLSLVIMLCRATVEEYPESPGAQTCRSLLHEILKPALSIRTEKVVLPGEPAKILVEYKQVPVLYVTLLKTDNEGIGYEKISSQLNNRKPINIGGKGVVRSWQVNLPAGDALVAHNTEIKADPLPEGNYILLFAANPAFDPAISPVVIQPIQYSTLALLTTVEPEGGLTMWVTNRKTGRPLKNATVSVYKKEYDYNARKYTNKPEGKYITDAGGLAKMVASPENGYDSYSMDVSYGKSRLQTIANINRYSRYKTPEDPQRTTHYFTDRSIYRPGQVVYFKGILVEKKGEEVHILAGEKTTVVFLNVNGEEVAELKLTTNDYGAFSGSFIAPLGVLNGSMTIRNETGSQTVQIEEYKRPRFEVEILPVEQVFKLNEKASVKGKATSYAGASISGAEVKYSIRRVADFPWWWRWCFWGRPMPSGTEKIIGTGTTVTDAEGRFEVVFKASPDLSLSPEDKPFFRYEVTVEVVDITGETQAATGTIKVGYQSLDADITVAEILDRNKTNKFDINTSNLNGGFEPATIKITVSELQQPAKPLRERLWPRPDTMSMSMQEHMDLFPEDEYREEMDKNNWPVKGEITTTAFNTREAKSWSLPPGTLPVSGVYRVDFSATSSNGDEVALIKFFTAVSEIDEQLAEMSHIRVSLNKPSLQPGEELQINVGSAMEKAVAWLRVAHKGKVIWEGLPEINNNIRKISIPITEEYIGGLEIVYAMVNNNRVYQGQLFAEVPAKSTQLQVAWKTFRDKLLPGQQENWELTIRGPEGESVAAEMVATLYDASLDAFLPHAYSFGPFGQKYYNGYLVTPDKSPSFGLGQGSEYYNNAFIAPGTRLYPTLQNFGFALGINYRYLYARGGAMMESQMKMMTSDEVMSIEAASPAPPVPGEQPIAKPVVANAPKVRTNLNETAFFFPHLRTNDQGDVVLSFTMPEALTRWNMLAIAHTQDLNTASLIRSVVTQKDLMVTPNAPRFLREGDQLRFTAKVNNLSEQALSGTARLVLKDALSGKVVSSSFGLLTELMPFTIGKGQSTLVTWNIRVPENIGAVSYEVTATAGNFSDGEGATLPVLSNRMLVTETMPVYVNGNQKKSFTFKTLKENKSSTLQHQRLSFELTSNPAWYAIQALPYMMEYPYECAEQLFSRFYANALAGYIANSSPKIKEVFGQWKSSGELLSQLDKNPELKALLLEETPWVRDAKNEAEARNRVAQLFDLEKVVKEGVRALDQLKNAQTPNGGFAWFKGMPDNRYITQHIVAGFGHLQQLGVINLQEDEAATAMLSKAISYLDDRMAEDFRELKKQDKDYLQHDHIGHLTAHYLYARSFFPNQPVGKQNKEAYDFHLQQAGKYWVGKSIYIQGLLALALHSNGQGPIAAKIIEGLRQNAVQSEEMGMYWKSLQRGGWYWYEAPVETQALLIEAFNTISHKGDEVDKMRQWLLKQKQTQSWPTTKATAEACYALLLSGTDWLSDEAPVKVWMGGQLIDPLSEGATVEPGTGYYKITKEGNEVTAQMSGLQLQKNTKGPAWGAMYWQYFEQLDKIGTQATGLQLVKRVFREEKTDAGPRLFPITEQTPLHPGDILKVRLELRTDRDLEFVQMKDMRASGLEPINVLSQYQYKGGLSYYESTRDAATNFFFDWLPKGTYVFEYPLRVNLAGDFSNGLTTIQSMYAPEFSSHTEGVRLKVEEK